MTTAYNAIPAPVETIDAPVSNAQIAEWETPRVLFFAGDAITDIEKRQADYKSFGGIHLPHCKTLRDTKGMLYKCQLTRLPAFKMIPEWREMLGPNMAALQFENAFVQTVVRSDGSQTSREVKGFPMSVPSATKKGEFATEQSDHIVWKKRYPAHDVAMAVKRSAPHGPGGVVEVTALKGASVADVAEAQRFFFPNWDDIKGGRSQLPEKMRDVEAHIKMRKEAIDFEIGEDKRGKYHSIANDMLRSCSEFIRTANETVRSDASIVQNAIQKGLAGQVNHSQASEKFLEQTGAQRKEDLLTGEVASVGELAKEMREDRLANSKVKEKELELKERELFLREVELGIRKPDGSLAGETKAPTSNFEIVEGDIQMNRPMTGDVTEAIEGVSNLTAMGEKALASEVICGAPTANGTCARVATKGDKCWQHADGD